MGSPKITAIIADQSQIFRTALSEFLLFESIKVIGEAGNTRELIEVLQQKVPDILIYDEFSYNENFKFTAESLFAVAPGIKILVLSLDNSDACVNFYIEQGASGFCDKNMKNYDELVQAIKLVCSGKKFFPDIKKKVLRPN